MTSDTACTRLAVAQTVKAIHVGDRLVEGVPRSNVGVPTRLLPVRENVETGTIGDVLDAVCALSECDRDVLHGTLTLALEIAREGREGKRVGTLFTVGRADRVLASSRLLILDPLAGHPRQLTHVWDARLRGTVKELAQLDGAFVIAEDGAVVSAGRYLDVSTAGVEIPLGLGTRHLAAAATSRHHGVVAIAVSEGGVVRIFCRGEIVASLIP
jgi:DNA integrity scanning protein DisA with diadenylate cyclase activity